jgi:hypothetical protein
VGYRHFDAVDPQVPDFSGVVLQVMAGYTLLEREVRSGPRAGRAVFMQDRGIFISTGGRLTVASVDRSV